jgi:hypothetical protein
MKTIVVNGRIFRSEMAAREYCQKNGYRVTNTATQTPRRGSRYNVEVWDVVSEPAPDSGYVAAQEEAYFDNFCFTNNI